MISPLLSLREIGKNFGLGSSRNYDRIGFLVARNLTTDELRKTDLPLKLISAEVGMSGAAECSVLYMPRASDSALAIIPSDKSGQGTLGYVRLFTKAELADVIDAVSGPPLGLSVDITAAFALVKESASGNSGIPLEKLTFYTPRDYFRKQTD